MSVPAGSVPGRGFAFKATNTRSCAKGREEKKRTRRKWPKDFPFFIRFVHFYVSLFFSLINQNNLLETDLGEIDSLCMSSFKTHTSPRELRFLHSCVFPFCAHCCVKNIRNDIGLYADFITLTTSN